MYNEALKTIKVNAPASVEIEPGDFLYLSNHLAYPASNLAYTTLTTVESTFVTSFLGVSQDKRNSLETLVEPIEIATTGRTSVKCTDTASAYDAGTLYGLDGDGTHLYNQQVKEVSSLADAVGVLVEAAAAHCTSVKLGIVNTITLGA